MCSDPAPLRDLQRPSVYGLLVDQGRVLLVRASGASGRWWLPGGGMDFGETPTEALIREFEEETGTVVQPQALIDVVSDVLEYPLHGVRVHAVRALYRVETFAGTIRAEVGGSTDSVEWHDLESAMDLPLVPFARDLLGTLGGRRDGA